MDEAVLSGRPQPQNIVHSRGPGLLRRSPLMISSCHMFSLPPDSSNAPRQLVSSSIPISKSRVLPTRARGHRSLPSALFRRAPDCLYPPSPTLVCFTEHGSLNLCECVARRRQSSKRGHGAAAIHAQADSYPGLSTGTIMRCACFTGTKPLKMRGNMMQPQDGSPS